MSFLAELKRRNVLRVAAGYAVTSWLVIQVVETIFPIYDLSDEAIRMVISLLAIGALPILVLAWVLELTPEGLKLEKDVDRSQSISRQTGKNLDRMIIVALALALGYFAVDKFMIDPARDAAREATIAELARSEAVVESYGDKSIAVLPFADMSPDSDQEYLADGIAEELLNLLARIPELRVISRSSTFSYKDKDFKVTDVARELNVAHILEGSVRKAGKQVRITAQLIDARSDTHLWSETYDRPLDNIFAIQDEIAAEVVDLLKIKLLGDAPAIETTNPEAYALVLQARHLERLGAVASAEEAVRKYQQALAIAPDYSVAWSGLSRVYSGQAGRGTRPVDEGFRLARETARKALAADPANAEAHARLASIARAYDNDIAGAALHYEQALTLDPTNPDIIRHAAILLQSLGRIDESIALSEYVTARDPLSPTGHTNLCLAYIYAGRMDDAIASCRAALTLSPNKTGGWYNVGRALLLKGEYNAAMEAFASESDEEYRVKGTAIALHSLGQKVESEGALVELRERWGDRWPSEVAQVYAWNGNADAAFEWLDRAIAQNEDGLNQQFMQPFFAPLHAEPRWKTFRERSGTSESQLAL
ncbi:MAG: tetratricopeptide repeat protein, partial [Gammaproteobacteria bacterium]